jgi:hypothetical protein
MEDLVELLAISHPDETTNPIKTAKTARRFTRNLRPSLHIRKTVIIPIRTADRERLRRMNMLPSVNQPHRLIPGRSHLSRIKR